MYSADGETLYLYPIGKTDASYTIPDGVKTINEYAFEANGLTSITFNEGLTSIGEYAFTECVNLTSISLPASLTKTGSEAFKECG